MKFTANIGKTRYELEETSTPDVLKVTRQGPDEQTFFLPASLVVDYVCHKVVPRTADHVVRDMAKVYVLCGVCIQWPAGPYASMGLKKICADPHAACESCYNKGPRWNVHQYRK